MKTPFFKPIDCFSRSLLLKFPLPHPSKAGWPWVEESNSFSALMPNGKPWPKISIVTPSYNQGEFLEETIRSVLLQNYPNLEYIIMDGGSTDDSLDIIKKYEPWLAHWQSSRDNGQVDAINKGFLLAEGSILGWLNSDDIYCDRVFQRIAFLDWHKTDFCYGKGMWFSRRSKDICLYPTFAPSIYTLKYQCTLCQPTVFFTRNVFIDIGVLPFNFYCAFDYEYWIKAVFGKKKFKFVPYILAKSRMYSQNKSLSCRNSVLDEIVALKCKYYSGFRLNLVLDLFFRITIHRYTIIKTKFLINKLREL